MSANSFSICLVFSALFLIPLNLYLPNATAITALGGGGTITVRKDERWPLVSSEFGEISAVKISDGMNNGCYSLHFITMDPHSLLLPVYLYSKMVFYVNSGNGTLSWIDVADKDNYELQQLKLKTGDIYTLQPQSVFYLQNNLEANDTQDLQIYAIFLDSNTSLRNQQCGLVYAAVHDLVLQFDNKVLQATLNVKEEVIEELKGGERQRPLIVQEHDLETNTTTSNVSSWVLRTFLRTQSNDVFPFVNKKKKGKDKKKKKKDKKKKDKKEKDKRKAYNIFKVDHDVENSNGWSVTVTNEQLDVLHDDFSVFMVNLTEGSMMGPHWNPTSEEIVIVLSGQGMVQVVCPSIASETDCKSSRIKVQEGDVFVVPRYNPLAQMSFSNKSFVFMGFTMTSENNPHQYLTGENSILQTLNKKVLVESFDVRNTTLIDEVLSAQKENTIFMECKSCAEDEERLMMEEEVEREWEGGGGGWHEAVLEGEIARRDEQEMQRRLREAEAVGGG